MTEGSRDREPLSGIPEGLGSTGGLTNPGFAFTSKEPKVRWLSTVTEEKRSYINAESP